MSVLNDRPAIEAKLRAASDRAWQAALAAQAKVQDESRDWWRYFIGDESAEAALRGATADLVARSQALNLDVVRFMQLRDADQDEATVRRLSATLELVADSAEYTAQINDDTSLGAYMRGVAADLIAAVVAVAGAVASAIGPVGVIAIVLIAIVIFAPDALGRLVRATTGAT